MAPIEDAGGLFVGRKQKGRRRKREGVRHKKRGRRDARHRMMVLAALLQINSMAESPRY